MADAEAFWQASDEFIDAYKMMKPLKNSKKSPKNSDPIQAQLDKLQKQAERNLRRLKEIKQEMEG